MRQLCVSSGHVALVRSGPRAAGHRGTVAARLRRALCGATLALAALACSQAFAQEKAPRVFTVAVEAVDYQPFYDGSGPQYAGIARKALDAFAARHGYRFEYVALPVSRVQQEFYIEGKYDFTFPNNPAWRLAAKGRAPLPVRYSAPVLHVTEGIVVAPDRAAMRAEDLRIIGTMRGFTLPPFVSALQAKGLDVAYADSTTNLVRTLAAGRIDGIFFAAEVIRHAERRAPGVQGHPTLATHMPSARVAFSLSTQRHAAVIAQFDADLRRHAAEYCAITRAGLEP